MGFYQKGELLCHFWKMTSHVFVSDFVSEVSNKGCFTGCAISSQTQKSCFHVTNTEFTH